MTQPLVSIIMPAYNAEKYIAEAIESVLNQDYTKFELIIINDGSKDKTESIINSFDDKRIKYYSQENKGVSAGRNLGLKIMVGDFFCFLDADDYYPINSISSRITIFENSTINFVDGNVLIVDKNLEKTIRKFTPKLNLENPLDDLIKLNGNCFMGMSWMIRNNKNIKPFKEEISHCEDLIFFIENSKNGFYSFTEETILKYRQVNHSAMRNLKGLHQGYQYTFNFLVENKYDNNLINTFKSKYLSIMFKSYLKNFHIFEAIKVLLLSK